jgi:hypothetical protein
MMRMAVDDTQSPASATAATRWQHRWLLVAAGS